MNNLDDAHSDLPGHVLATLDRKAADATHAVRSSHPSPPPFDPGRRLPPSALSVGLAAAMLFLVAGTALVLAASGRSDDPEPQRFAGPIDQLGPLVPTYLPDGLVLTEVMRDMAPASESDAVLRWITFGLASSPDPYDGPTVSLSWGEASDQPSEPMGTSIEIMGTEARLVDRPVGPMLSWTHDRADHVLTGRWVSADTLVELAEELIGNAVPDLAAFGWDELGGAEVELVDALGVALFFGLDGESGSPLLVGWNDPGHQSIDLLRTSIQIDAACEAGSFTACGGRTVQVGQRQVLSSPVGDGMSSGYHLTWFEPDGRLAWVTGWSIDEEELVRVVEGLRPGVWDELDVRDGQRPTPVPDTTMAPNAGTSGDPTGSPARDEASARALVGDPRFQLRPILVARGEPNGGWSSPRRPVDAEPLPPDAPATVLGVAVDGWYPGAYDVAAAVLDGSGLVDAYPLTSPANAFSVRGDRVWLRFDADAQALLAELVAECTAGSDTCPTGRVAVLWADEVIAIADLAPGPVGSTLTIEVGSWGRSRWPE